jgi:hypothetical protein
LKADDTESARDKLKREISKKNVMPTTTSDESGLLEEKTDSEFQQDKPPHHA